MSVTARVYGDKLDLADELEDDFRKDATGAVRDAAKILLDTSKRLIAQHGTNAPAPPGSTPATVTGNLLRLTKLKPARVRGRVASAGVQWAPHSFLVEYGHTTPEGGRVLPRPFVRPAEIHSEKPITDLLRARLT